MPDYIKLVQLTVELNLSPASMFPTADEHKYVQCSPVLEVRIQFMSNSLWYNFIYVASVPIKIVSRCSAETQRRKNSLLRVRLLVQDACIRPKLHQTWFAILKIANHLKDLKERGRRVRGQPNTTESARLVDAKVSVSVGFSTWLAWWRKQCC